MRRGNQTDIRQWYQQSSNIGLQHPLCRCHLSKLTEIPVRLPVHKKRLYALHSFALCLLLTASSSAFAASVPDPSPTSELPQSSELPSQTSDLPQSSALPSQISQLPPQSSAVTSQTTNRFTVTSAADRYDVNNFKPRTSQTRPKLGLALGGGGARGAAEVAVLQAFEKEGIKFDYITGTSVGAVIGALYSAGVPLERIKQDATDGSMMRHFMNVPLALHVLLEPIYLAPRIFGARPYDGLYSGNKFRKYLTKALPPNRTRFEDLPTPFVAVSFNLIDGKPYMIRSGPLEPAMQASSAVPGLRKPVALDGKLFVDGGVSCNLPVKQCRELGADFVVAVNIDQPFNEFTLQQFTKPGSVTRRMINWDLYSIDKPQEQLADVVIHPDVGTITLVTTSKKQARHAYKAGEAAVQAALPDLRLKLQKLGALPTTDEAAHQ